MSAIGSVATEQPAPMSAILVGPGIICWKNPFKATELLHCMILNRIQTLHARTVPVSQ